MGRSSRGIGRLSFDRPRELNTLDATCVRARRLPAFKRLACRDMVAYGTRRPAGEQARDVRTSGTTHGRGFTMTFAYLLRSGACKKLHEEGARRQAMRVRSSCVRLSRGSLCSRSSVERDCLARAACGAT